jgi:hypothetical protein
MHQKLCTMHHFLCMFNDVPDKKDVRICAFQQ